MSTVTVDVTVVVVSWNTRDLTLACLRSVEAEAVNSSTSIEIVLVDNGSSDGTVDAVVSALPSARVIELPENVGFARAANRGIAEGTGRFALLLNSDAELPVDSISRLVATLDEHPKAAAVGSALVGPDGERQFSCGRFLNPVNQFAETLGLSRVLPFRGLRRSYRAAEFEADVVEVDWCVGACLFLRRSAVESVGALDERFFMYSEDEDLCLRLHEAGWTVLHLPDLKVYHHGGGSAARVLERMRSEARDSQNAFVRKHFGATKAAVFRFLMSLARLKPRRDTSHVGWGR